MPQVDRLFDLRQASKLDKSKLRHSFWGVLLKLGWPLKVAGPSDRRRRIEVFAVLGLLHETSCWALVGLVECT